MGVLKEPASAYVAVDLETTGLDPKRDKIIEVGAFIVAEGRIIKTYETFVNPYRELTDTVVSLTGIRNEDLEDAPDIKTVIREFTEFSGELPILGHHVIFDYSFLKRAAVNIGLSFERCGIDTLKLARHFMPPEEKKNLANACAYFNIELEKSHRALEDARAAHLLYEKLTALKEAGDFDGFSPQPLIYKVKKEQPASKIQKEHLQDLLKYHRISLTAQIDHLSRNEISRITDKIIARYGRI